MSDNQDDSESLGLLPPRPEELHESAAMAKEILDIGRVLMQGVNAVQGQMDDNTTNTLMNSPESDHHQLQHLETPEASDQVSMEEGQEPTPEQLIEYYRQQGVNLEDLTAAVARAQLAAVAAGFPQLAYSPQILEQAAQMAAVGLSDPSLLNSVVEIQNATPPPTPVRPTKLIPESLVQVALERNDRKAVDGKYGCDFCDKAFARLYNLKTHLKSHMGSKPFVCDICQQRFTRNHDLNRHMKTHSKEKPFLCEMCGTSFARRDALKRHQNNKSATKKAGCAPGQSHQRQKQQTPGREVPEEENQVIMSLQDSLELQRQIQDLSTQLSSNPHFSASEVLATLGLQIPTETSDMGISQEEAMKAVEALAALVAVAQAQANQANQS